MDNELISNIRMMLWEDWDPIGVNQFPEASDEYDNYASEVAGMVCRNATEQEMFDHLWALETGYFGLQGDRDNTARFAAKLNQFAEQYNATR